MIHEVLDLTTPWKWANVEGRSRTRTISNMQHHILHAVATISVLHRFMPGTKKN